MAGIGCQGCVINFFRIQLSNFFITDFRHTKELYLILFHFLREVDGGSIGGVTFCYLFSYFRVFLSAAVGAE